MNAPDTSSVTPSTSASKPLRLGFENTYARLPEHFFARLNPTPVAAPRLIKVNVELTKYLGINPEALASPEGVEVLAGNRVAHGSEPLAIAYAGNQFGHFVPRLGDGRANLLGEVVARDGQRYDIQLKGSGRTPFSRGGDGRAALGPVLREYIVSEAMAVLGVPTTRALAAVATGEPVFRETPLPGAVLTRVAASHLRVGTFQYFAARSDVDGLRRLADYAITRHYPDAGNSGRPYGTFFAGVVQRQARLVAQWILLGFIHGVMNTDNTSISGETIDYGPCAFMEAFDPEQVYSSIDHGGRYNYSNQPNAAHWNLARLAEALLPLFVLETGSDEGALAAAHEALATFAPTFDQTRESGLRRKLGLTTEREGDMALAEDLLQRMASNNADFTLTFRKLSEVAANPERDAEVRALFANPAAYDTWATVWRQRLNQEPISPETRAESMRATNPLFIPRNHLVEEVIQAALLRQDFQPFEDLLERTSRPYEDLQDVDRVKWQRYADVARPEQCVSATFCGT